MEKGIKKKDLGMAPEQKITNPIGKDVTRDHVSGTMHEMNEKLELLFHEASKRKTAGENPAGIYEELNPKIEDIISETYFSTKQPTPPEIVEETKKRLADELGVSIYSQYEK